MTLTTIKYFFQLNALKIALQQLQENAERAVSIKSASCIQCLCKISIIAFCARRPIRQGRNRAFSLKSPNSQPRGTEGNALSGLYPSTCSPVEPIYKTSVDIALGGNANAQTASPRNIGDHIEEGLCSYTSNNLFKSPDIDLGDHGNAQSVTPR